MLISDWSSDVFSSDLIALEKFLAEGKYQVQRHDGDNYGFIAFEDFVRDPEAHPRKTESGKFEIYCRQLNARSKAYGWSEVPPIAKYIPPVKGYESTFDDWQARRKGAYPFQIVRSEEHTSELQSLMRN